MYTPQEIAAVWETIQNTLGAWERRRSGPFIRIHILNIFSWVLENNVQCVSDVEIKTLWLVRGWRTRRFRIYYAHRKYFPH